MLIKEENKEGLNFFQLPWDIYIHFFTTDKKKNWFCIKRFVSLIILCAGKISRLQYRQRTITRNAFQEWSHCLLLWDSYWRGILLKCFHHQLIGGHAGLCTCGPTGPGCLCTGWLTPEKLCLAFVHNHRHVNSPTGEYCNSGCGDLLVSTGQSWDFLSSAIIKRIRGTKTLFSELNHSYFSRIVGNQVWILCYCSVDWTLFLCPR